MTKRCTGIHIYPCFSVGEAGGESCLRRNGGSGTCSTSVAPRVPGGGARCRHARAGAGQGGACGAVEVKAPCGAGAGAGPAGRPPSSLSPGVRWGVSRRGWGRGRGGSARGGDEGGGVVRPSSCSPGGEGRGEGGGGGDLCSPSSCGILSSYSSLSLEALWGAGAGWRGAWAPASFCLFAFCLDGWSRAWVPASFGLDSWRRA